MGEQSNEFQRNVLVFYQMLCNAFRDEDDRDVECEKLELNEGTDLNEIIVAMVSAAFIFCQQISPENFGDQDLLGFTHILNRLVVQHMYMNDSEDEA